MLTLTDVKTALRIDSNVDDAYLDILMQGAAAYMRGAVNDYDKKRELSAATDNDNFGAKADIAEMSLVAEWYEHRVAAGKESFTPITRYLINQLQYDAEFEVDGDGSIE